MSLFGLPSTSISKTSFSRGVKAGLPSKEGLLTTPLARSTKVDSNLRDTHTEPRLTARTALDNKPGTSMMSKSQEETEVS